MFPPTSERVENATPEYINKLIYDTTINKLSKIIQTSSEQGTNIIEQRLNQLNHEWDIERLLECNGSIIILTSFLLGYFFSCYWFFILVAITTFLFIHAIHGWAPPLAFLRKTIGMRTSVEILSEKVALKILRGDFQSINPAVFQQQGQNSMEYNAKQLLDLANLHSYNDNKTKKQL